MTAAERLTEMGYEGVVILENYSYDDALIGVTEDGRAVYDYGRMIDWLMDQHGFSYMDAAEWIDYNTIRALPYMGANAPIVMYRLEDME